MRRATFTLVFLVPVAILVWCVYVLAAGRAIQGRELGALCTEDTESSCLSWSVGDTRGVAKVSGKYFYGERGTLYYVPGLGIPDRSLAWAFLFPALGVAAFIGGIAVRRRHRGRISDLLPPRPL